MRALSTMFVLCAAVLGASVLCAAENLQASLPQGAAAPEPLAWLKSGDYAALEEQYSEQQRNYEAGRLSEQALYDSFRKLNEQSPGNAVYFDRWVQSFPRSYAALLARGFYGYRMAVAARGDNGFNHTSWQQIKGMRDWLARARPDLIASLELTAKPYLSTLYLLNIAILDGSRSEIRHWYEAGIALDPGNKLVRYRYMFSLRPRWGGSYREMQEFLHQCEDQQLPPAFLARLRMLIHADLAEDAMRASDETRMLDEWQQVIGLAEVAGEQPSTEALIGYTRAAQDLNRPAEAERGLRLLEGRDPQDTWSAGQLGWIYARAHRDAQAWPLLLRAAEQNDPWAQFVVGHDTYRGIPPLHKAPDQTAGLVWIRRSAAQCYPDAMQFLAAHGEAQPSNCRRGAKSQDWQAALIRMGVGALLTSVITGLVAARRQRSPVRGQTGRMQHPPSTLILGVVGFVLFGGAAIFCSLYDSGTFVTGVSAVLAAFALLRIAEYYRIRYELTPEGLSYGRLLGQRGSLRWSDVMRISYSTAMRRFRIETSSGEVVSISAMLTGLPEFAGAVLAHVPSYAIDEGTRALLQSTAAGELPRLA